MPRLDPGMQTGKVVEWLKKEGEQVRKGEPILVVEGEKTTFEIEANETGVLTKILAKPGDDVPVTQVLAIIGQPSTPPPAATSTEIKQHPSSPTPTAQLPPSTRQGPIASPAARRLAQERGVDLAEVLGTGPGGRITSDDIIAAANKKTSTPTTLTQLNAAVLKRTKLEGIRKVVAERLAYSARNTVPVTITTEVDATSLVALKEKESHIAFTALVVKAAAKALEKHSGINSTLEGDEIVTYSQINVALAVHTDRGLVAPVVHNTNKKSLREINSEINDLSQKAKENRLTIENLTGGTFTVTNLGAYDVESFAPIINPPQCGILGLGKIAYKPMATGNQVTAKPATTLTLVFDHRIVDGVPAAQFLRDVKSNLENAEGLV